METAEDFVALNNKCSDANERKLLVRLLTFFVLFLLVIIKICVKNHWNTFLCWVKTTQIFITWFPLLIWKEEEFIDGSVMSQS